MRNNLMNFQVTESAKTAANGEITEYKSLVNYAGTLTDTLLYIHYIAVLLIEVRHLQPTFYLKVCNIFIMTFQKIIKRYLPSNNFHLIF